MQIKHSSVLTGRFKLGFLGGGQLARMMILEAQNLGIECHVFCASKQDPAAQVTAHWTSGSITDLKALIGFIENVDLVTFESEFVPAEALEKLDSKMSDKIFPKPSIMREMQNRQTQKNLLIQHKIPTASFVTVNTPSDLDIAWKELKGPFVLKTCYGGYDGYGTFFARKFSDLGNLATTVANSEQAFIAEKMISFKRELAAIFVRNQNGEMICLPLVESKQEQGACDYVVGPIKHVAFARMQKKIKKMMSELHYVGALGVEFFDTGKELLVNELAPRVHNTGHYSQEALKESQFLLHVKAGLGFSLAKPEILEKAFVMTNIMGSHEKALKIPSSIEGKIHLYGKSENRPRRKMGHVNYTGKNAKTLLAKALKERKLFQA